MEEGNGKKMKQKVLPDIMRRPQEREKCPGFLHEFDVTPYKLFTGLYPRGAMIAAVRRTSNSGEPSLSICRLAVQWKLVMAIFGDNSEVFSMAVFFHRNIVVIQETPSRRSDDTTNK